MKPLCDTWTRATDIDKLADQIATLLLIVMKKSLYPLIGIYHKGEECFSRFDWLVKRRLANTSHLRAARETKSRVNLSVSKRIVVD